jgi:subtilisin family serine protease
MNLRYVKLASGSFAFLVFAIAAFAKSPATRSSDEAAIQNGFHLEEASRLPYQQVSGEILVRYRNSVSRHSRSLIHARLGTKVVKEFKHIKKTELVRIPRGMSVHDAVKKFSEYPNVLYAEPNFRVAAQAIPNDPQFPLQWGLYNTVEYGVAGADINALAAWDLTTGGENTVVAVIDTGVDYTHPDLADNMFRNEADCNNNGIDDDGNGYVDDCHGINVVDGNSDPMDDDSHGTHIAGIIGAAGNNSVGITGVNWTTRILACKFLDSEGFGTTAGAIECLDYLAEMKDRGVNIVASNNSWGFGLNSQALRDAIDEQRQRGILFIAAAGDAELPGDNAYLQILPCSYDLPNVVCVASTGAVDNLSYFSNYGKQVVHIGAPGQEIISTVPVGFGSYETMSGSSMAAPFVAGVAGLINAYYPGSDWLSIRNRILAGGDVKEGLAETTITGRRLNAYGALTCGNSTVLGRLRPLGPSLMTAVGVPIELSALHINCIGPNGEVTVTVSPTGETVTLVDNGLGNDLVAGDGIYTGSWTPSSGGTFTLAFPNDDNVTVNVDPDLQAGFPVKALHTSGSGGGAMHTLIANVNGDARLQIFTTSLYAGPLNAWDSAGATLPGWPLETGGPSHPTAGELSTTSVGNEIAMANGRDLLAVDGIGALLPGWPINQHLYTMSCSPALADVDSDGLDEIFVVQGDFKLNGFGANGTALAGWPVVDNFPDGSTPAIIDLDGDGDLEVIEGLGNINGEGFLYAYHHDGTPVVGFPATFTGYLHASVVVGDVDGDGHPEIVVIDKTGSLWTQHAEALIYSGSGALKRSIPLAGNTFFGTMPALADLDGDGVQEIIVQTEKTQMTDHTGYPEGAINVVRGDGTNYPGWPVMLPSGYQIGNSAPVIGDADGDGLPDIVLTLREYDDGATDTTGLVLVYSRNGVLHPHFPKTLPIGAGAVPAIADIDADGRNEIIITGNYWGADIGLYSGYYDKVWVYDLGGPSYGPTLWGQFMGNARHTGASVTVNPNPRAYRLLRLAAGSGGSVTSNPNGINCGSDCSKSYVRGTSIVLTAEAADGYRFDLWGGACAGQQGSTCTLVMDADKSVSAQFALLQYRLTVALSGSGSGTVTASAGGINCGSACTAMFDSNTPITLTAAAASGSTFSNWSGVCASSGLNCPVTMTSDLSVTATFKKNSTTSGGGSSKSSGGKCFIATAAYGSSMAEDVVILRQFRDRHLLSNNLGRVFVNWYYRNSPPVAALISQHKLLRAATRTALFPIVSAIKHPWAACLLLVTSGILLMAGKKAWKSMEKIHAVHEAEKS